MYSYDPDYPEFQRVVNNAGYQDELISTIGAKDIQALLLQPIHGRDLDQWLAWTVFNVAPSYLPLITENASVIALHLRPGRSLQESPLVYIPQARRDVIFMVDRFEALSIVLWLLIAQYLNESDEEHRQLEEATESIRDRLGGPHVPESMWKVLKEAQDSEEKYLPASWYVSTDSLTRRAWSNAPIDHPYIGMPHLKRHSKPEEALKRFESFVEKRRDIPDILAMYLRIQLEAGEQVRREDVLAVFDSECWRHRESLRRGHWYASGDGLDHYDAILQNLPDRDEILGGTRFEALVDHPEAYSGKDPEGPALLIDIAESYRDDGNLEGALDQLRNAALLSQFTGTGVSPELADRIADVCAELADESLAEKVARRSAEMLRDGLRKHL